MGSTASGVVDCFYIALLSTLQQTYCALVSCDSEINDCSFFKSHFEYPLQDTSQKPNAGNLSNFTAETYLEIATGNRVIQGSDMSEGLALWEAFLEIELYFPKEQRESKEFLFFTFASEAFEVFTLLDRKKSLQKFVIYLTFRAGSILIKVQKILQKA